MRLAAELATRAGGPVAQQGEPCHSAQWGDRLSHLNFPGEKRPQRAGSRFNNDQDIQFGPAWSSIAEFETDQKRPGSAVVGAGCFADLKNDTRAAPRVEVAKARAVSPISTSDHAKAESSACCFCLVAIGDLEAQMINPLAILLEKSTLGRVQGAGLA